MQLLNKKTDYAIRILIYLSKNKDKHCSSTEISEGINIPLQYTRQILQKLVKIDYVSSKEGIGGGVLLNKSPESINLSNVIEIFQGIIQISSCMFRKNICPERPTCVLRKRIQSIENIVHKEFDSITISTLLNDMED
ncbi:MAG: Rrf2 family transcriptional regulator [Candidatus Theseobacter exili]|nr:Rrf2 family transcriptional regulator [Candidatus Theseobacter exili]